MSADAIDPVLREAHQRVALAKGVLHLDGVQRLAVNGPPVSVVAALQAVQDLEGRPEVAREPPVDGPHLHAGTTVPHHQQGLPASASRLQTVHFFEVDVALGGDTRLTFASLKPTKMSVTPL